MPCHIRYAWNACVVCTWADPPCCARHQVCACAPRAHVRARVRMHAASRLVVPHLESNACLDGHGFEVVVELEHLAHVREVEHYRVNACCRARRRAAEVVVGQKPLVRCTHQVALPGLLSVPMYVHDDVGYFVRVARPEDGPAPRAVLPPQAAAHEAVVGMWGQARPQLLRKQSPTGATTAHGDGLHTGHCCVLVGARTHELVSAPSGRHRLEQAMHPTRSCRAVSTHER